MFCKHCGSKLEGTPKFCPQCGGSLVDSVPVATVAPVTPPPAQPEQISVPVTPVQPAQPQVQPAPVQNVYAPVVPVQTQSNYQQNQQASYQGNLGSFTSGSGSCSFDGEGGDLIIQMLLYVGLALITLGFGIPWGLCNLYKWRMSHTIVNGRRLAFTGTGGELFLKYLKWVVLCIVTLGIYSFWMYKELKSWEVSHTFYADQNPQAGQESTTSFFDGTVGEYVSIGLLGALLCVVTCGIYGPWFVCKLYKWEMSHTVIDGDRLDFNGSGVDFFVEYLKIMLFSLITCGIYQPWGICSLNRWTWENTFVQSKGNVRA